MLKWLSEKLFPGDGDGNTNAPKYPPRVGAAGLLIEAAVKDGTYTEQEREIADRGLMNLFHLGASEAAALRTEAEEAQATSTTKMGFMIAAKELADEDRVRLISVIKSIIASHDGVDMSEHLLLHSVGDIFGLSRQAIDAIPAHTPSQDAL